MRIGCMANKDDNGVKKKVIRRSDASLFYHLHSENNNIICRTELNNSFQQKNEELIRRIWS